MKPYGLPVNGKVASSTFQTTGLVSVTRSHILHQLVYRVLDIEPSTKRDFQLCSDWLVGYFILVLPLLRARRWIYKDGSHLLDSASSTIIAVNQERQVLELLKNEAPTHSPRNSKHCHCA